MGAALASATYILSYKRVLGAQIDDISNYTHFLVMDEDVHLSHVVTNLSTHSPSTHDTGSNTLAD